MIHRYELITLHMIMIHHEHTYDVAAAAAQAFAADSQMNSGPWPLGNAACTYHWTCNMWHVDLITKD